MTEKERITEWLDELIELKKKCIELDKKHEDLRHILTSANNITIQLYECIDKVTKELGLELVERDCGDFIHCECVYKGFYFIQVKEKCPEQAAT